MLTVSLLALFGLNVQAQLPIYRETFGRPDPPAGTGNLSLTNWDWARFRSDGAANTGSGVNGTDFGNPINVANVNAGPNSDGTFGAYARGWAFLDGNGGAGLRLAMTTEYSFDPSAYGPGGVTFSWYQGNDYTTASSNIVNDFRLAVRVGTDWFVTAATFNNALSVESGTAFPTQSVFQAWVFDPTAANWLGLSFNGDYNPLTDTSTGSSLGVLATTGTPSTDLSGVITAFGLYRDYSGANVRFDSFTIEIVPEPSALALLGLGAAALAWRRRRA